MKTEPEDNIKIILIATAGDIVWLNGGRSDFVDPGGKPSLPRWLSHVSAPV